MMSDRKKSSTEQIGERGAVGEYQEIVGMKKGWEMKRFAEVLEIKNGKNQRDVISDSGIYPIYGSAGNVMGMATDFICEAGTTIIGRKGNINSPVFADTPFWNVDTAFGLSALKGMDSKFLFYFWLTYDFSALNRGTTIPSLVKSELLEIEIPVPPLAEQRRIVGVLDEAFTGLATAQANAQKNLQNARALFESHLQSVFSQRGDGWVEARLEDCCAEIFAGGDVPKDNHSKTPTQNHKIPIYTNGEKNCGLYGYTDKARVTSQSITISARGTIGYTVIRQESFFPAIRLIVVVPNLDCLDLGFLFHAVSNMNVAHSGTSIPQLTVPMVREFLIPLPPLSEQKQIVNQLDALAAETQRLETLYTQKLAALAELKKSLLHQAFSGEL
jgi:type I restriction enzyme S subunit